MWSPCSFWRRKIYLCWDVVWWPWCYWRSNIYSTRWSIVFEIPLPHDWQTGQRFPCYYISSLHRFCFKHKVVISLIAIVFKCFCDWLLSVLKDSFCMLLKNSWTVASYGCLLALISFYIAELRSLDSNSGGPGPHVSNINQHALALSIASSNWLIRVRIKFCCITAHT